MKKAGMVLLALVALYAISPAVRNLFGSVDRSGARTPLGSLPLKTLDGASWSLSDHHGEVVLLNFWATWCPPCRMETPGLVNIQKEYAGRGFTVIGVSMDDNPASVVPAFLRRYGVQYPIVAPAADSEALQRVEALPTSFLIDRSGKVAREYQGIVTEFALRRDIEKVLGEQR